MHQEFLMGNMAIAKGAIAAGLNLVAGYPGTPSTETLETVAKIKPKDVYVEWSVNEKAAMEVAAGASYAGARSMVTMKQMGLNVASDPLMAVEYIGVKGGMVVLVADDPGPISSQTEQDTRHQAAFSKLPCFDPSSVQEAYEMIQEAFRVSEKYHTPVLFRPTTRICHAYASIEVKDENEYSVCQPEGFVKDSSKWVIFPRLSFINHQKIVERNHLLSDVFSDYKANIVTNGSGSFTKKGIAAGGISYALMQQVLRECKDQPVTFKVSTPYPFPEKKAKEFLEGLDEVLVLEELDPVIEEELLKVAGKYNISITIHGKLDKTTTCAGENSIDLIRGFVNRFLGTGVGSQSDEKEQAVCPELPVRPPVLCAGCPHRASFYAVKQAMKGKKTIYSGDIGCYTLGNAMPLDMVDTCLCMGAGITIPQGIGHIEPDTHCFGFLGDSTFFASGMTGVVNAVYNQSNLTVVILDNSTTAMTGHQPHPGTGRTMMGDIVNKISIEQILRGIGVVSVETVDPLDLKEAVAAVKRADALEGVKAIIFKSPCIAIVEGNPACTVNPEKCIKCRKCINEIGCPGIVTEGDQVKIEPSLCTGCGLCSQICPTQAIGGEDHE